MASSIANVEISTDDFADLVGKLNQALTLLSSEVMTANSTSGSTTGNAELVGNLTAITFRSGNSTVNAVVNSTSVTISNSTVSISLTKPTAAQVSDGGYFWNANGSWTQAGGGGIDILAYGEESLGADSSTTSTGEVALFTGTNWTINANTTKVFAACFCPYRIYRAGASAVNGDFILQWRYNDGAWSAWANLQQTYVRDDAASSTSMTGYGEFTLMGIIDVPVGTTQLQLQVVSTTQAGTKQLFGGLPRAAKIYYEERSG